MHHVRSKPYALLTLFVAIALVGALASAGSAKALSGAKAKPACKAGKASTAAAPCTRLWVTQGCPLFIPMIKSVFGLTVTVGHSPKQPAGYLSCNYTADGTTTVFGLGFDPKGVTAADFQAALKSAPLGWSSCQVGTDTTSQTPTALPVLVSGLGTQAYEYDPCPGATVVDNGGNTNPDFAEGAVMRGVTEYSISGSVPYAQMNSFFREFVAKYL
jgi:hypothetical protein